MPIVENSNVTIAHLGIVAGMIDTLGIVEYIDKELPKKRHHAVTHGEATKALLLNSLGYVEQRLFVMPEYFEDVATERLIKEGIKPDQLNQYVFGECLDAIAAYGPTRLFTGIALQMLSKTKTGTIRLHYDTTSISVTGEYDSGFNTRLIQIVHGHSKDHRSDLKQFIISLVTNQHGIPLFMEPLSGNESDKKTLLKTIEQVRENLVTDETIYHMADSALYSADNVARLGDQCFWITRIPETITEVQQIVQSNPDWIKCRDARYEYATFTSSYGGIPQRWVLFRSEEQYRKSLQTYEKNQKKDLQRDQTALHKLCVKGFACEADARMTVERWLAKHPRYMLEQLDILEKHQRRSGKRGRPKKDEPLEQVYHVNVRFTFDPVVVTHEKELLGRFLLGSNDPTIDPEVMLEYYKEQSTVERGFRFIKDGRFHVSEVYLENENRIAALAMIMVLCLMVYSITEWQFRNTLASKNATIRDQYKKPTRKPSAKWLYFLFRRVRQIEEIVNNRRVCRILNYTSELVDIVHLLGPPVEKYYSLKN